MKLEKALAAKTGEEKVGRSPDDERRFYRKNHSYAHWGRETIL
jgi:hypothetical protein